MDDKETDSPATNETIKVNIFDQIYSLRSPRGAEHIRQLARVVDERMRQIAAHTTTFELSRIAVLAALNIADELEDLKTRLEVKEAMPSTDTDSPGEVEPSEERAESDETSTAQTWFDAIFDAEVPVKERSERLSSQVSSKLSSKLKTNRQENMSNLPQEEDK